MAQSLGQLVALETAARTEANKRLGVLFKQAQKPDLFEGFLKKYAPFGETDEERAQLSLQLPDEGKRVQLVAERLLAQFLAEGKQAINLALAKDTANCGAFADVIVEGETILSHVPASHLLHMEKVLADWGAFISALPVTKPTETWLDGEDGLKETAETFTNRNRVKKIPLPLHPGNEHHAPQVTVIEETVAEGRYTEVKYSGALRPDHKRELERRVAELRSAFKTAREQVNREDAVKVTTDEAAILERYILG
jgi:hypothetical protein